MSVEEVRCNICGSWDNELVLAVPDCIEPLSVFQLVRCKKCDLTFVSPRPKSINMQKYYPDDTYYAYQENNVKGFQKKLKLKVKTYLMEWAGGYRPKNHQVKTSVWIGSIVERVMRNHLIGVVPLKFRGKLLDVGCGNGDLMSWYRKRGWETVGIEPSPKGAMTARARGFKIIESSLEDASLPDDTFDAITVVQVLEHLRDPKGALTKLHWALRPGGLIVAGVPNFLCLDRHAIGCAWLPLEVPRHLYHFTPRSLQNLFEAVGFTVLEMRKKTIYRMLPSQIRENRRVKHGLPFIKDMAYLLMSPLFKLLAPKDYSSTFISVYAQK